MYIATLTVSDKLWVCQTNCQVKPTWGQEKPLRTLQGTACLNQRELMTNPLRRRLACPGVGLSIRQTQRIPQGSIMTRYEPSLYSCCKRYAPLHTSDDSRHGIG
jgi:hypothetical protein